LGVGQRNHPSNGNGLLSTSSDDAGILDYTRVFGYHKLGDQCLVAVLGSEGYIHEFCNSHQMPFRFELLIGDLYVAIFSHSSISEPHKPIEISGIEGIVAYLVNLYTRPSNFVIAPFLGHGEVLITCERMGRIGFAGDENPGLVSNAIARWQKWTGKQAAKTF